MCVYVCVCFSESFSFSFFTLCMHICVCVRDFSGWKCLFLEAMSWNSACLFNIPLHLTSGGNSWPNSDTRLHIRHIYSILNNNKAETCRGGAHCLLLFSLMKCSSSNRLYSRCSPSLTRGHKSPLQFLLSHWIFLSGFIFGQIWQYLWEFPQIPPQLST